MSISVSPNLAPLALVLLVVLAGAGQAAQAPAGLPLALSVAPPTPSASSAPTGPVSEGLSFGSTAILDACWTRGQLAGDDKDKAIQRRLKPDRQPPPDWAIAAAESALPPLAEGLAGSIRRVDPTDPEARLVALTFDLCEQANERAGYDAELVNALRAFGVKATFFAGGKWLRTHPEQAMQLMADPLFEIGNHAWTHGNLRVLHGEEARNQILWTQAEYQVLRRQLSERPCAVGAGPGEWELIPAWPKLFRFPYGTCDQGSLDAAAELGLASIQWSLVAGDPDRGRSARAIAQSIRAGVHAKGKEGRGAIVVAHANGRGWHTAEALPLFIPQLQAEGYRFLTVSELLAAGRPVSAKECYEVRPGDNVRYDRLFGRGTGG
ncbi:MAG TPA: polysaccharide deacetylase family protein [Chromatiaceae bacterium]|nr:polysaccharide deacetylase family protein [Chromatiaceae bacterium]